MYVVNLLVIASTKNHRQLTIIFPVFLYPYWSESIFAWFLTFPTHSNKHEDLISATHQLLDCPDKRLRLILDGIYAWGKRHDQHPVPDTRYHLSFWKPFASKLSLKNEVAIHIGSIMECNEEAPESCLSRFQHVHQLPLVSSSSCPSRAQSQEPKHSDCIVRSRSPPARGTIDYAFRWRV